MMTNYLMIVNMNKSMINFIHHLINILSICKNEIKYIEWTDIIVLDGCAFPMQEST